MPEAGEEGQHRGSIRGGDDDAKKTDKRTAEKKILARDYPDDRSYMTTSQDPTPEQDGGQPDSVQK